MPGTPRYYDALFNTLLVIVLLTILFNNLTFWLYFLNTLNYYASALSHTSPPRAKTSAPPTQRLSIVERRENEKVSPTRLFLLLSLFLKFET